MAILGPSWIWPCGLKKIWIRSGEQFLRRRKEGNLLHQQKTGHQRLHEDKLVPVLVCYWYLFYQHDLLQFLFLTEIEKYQTLASNQKDTARFVYKRSPLDTGTIFHCRTLSSCFRPGRLTRLRTALRIRIESVIIELVDPYSEYESRSGLFSL